MTFFLKIYEEPLIYVIASGGTSVSGLERCLSDAGNRPFHLLVVPYWNVEDDVNDLVIFSNVVEAFPNKIKVWYMCPTQEDADLLKARGAKAIHSHQNAFIDEDIFLPKSNIKKQFNAIHNAAMTPWKRHELAWGVKEICVVTYRHTATNSDVVVKNYKHIDFSNVTKSGDVEFLSNERVSELICASRCGLILSGIEGANFASGEYQFCGIPVISTPSKGGRAAFFDWKSTIVVKPESNLVEKAVEFAVLNPVDPVEIRGRVINKAIVHRERLIDWMSNIVGEKLHSKANKNARLPQFKDKLRKFV